jgi:hypothetical protein
MKLSNWWKRELIFVTVMTAAISLAASVFAAPSLTFVTKALDAHDREYTVYLDLSSKHMEGTYTTMTSYALWDTPVTSDGYSGIKWYKNVLQMDCARDVKRLTYIGYLDVNDKIIVDESYSDAPDEAITSNLVDAKEKPYYCGN